MLKIKNKIEFEDNLFVSLIDASKANSSQEERIKFVTDIASVCLGRLGFDDRDWITFMQEAKKNGISPAAEERIIWNKRLNLYNKLLTEAAGKASMPLRFVPVIVKAKIESIGDIFVCGYHLGLIKFLNEVTKYGFVDWYNDNKEELIIYTNLQCLLNAGITEENIPFNDSSELKNYKCVAGKLPKTAFDHLVTHGQLARIAESSRNKKYLNDVEFHYPNEWTNNAIRLMSDKDTERLNWFKDLYHFRTIKPEDATKELSCRRLILSAWAGWKQDENTWNNLFAQRAVGHTQAITKQVVNNIKKLINETKESR